MQLNESEKAELAEVYEKAAEYLEKHGWKQGDLGYDGQAPAHRVASWNDDPSRTKDEVINTLHALANKLR